MNDESEVSSDECWMGIQRTFDLSQGVITHHQRIHIITLYHLVVLHDRAVADECRVGRRWVGWSLRWPELCLDSVLGELGGPFALPLPLRIVVRALESEQGSDGVAGHSLWPEHMDGNQECLNHTPVITHVVRIHIPSTRQSTHLDETMKEPVLLFRAKEEFPMEVFPNLA